MSQSTRVLADRSRIFEAWHMLLKHIEQAGQGAHDLPGITLDQKQVLHSLLGYVIRLGIELERLARLKEVAPKWMSTVECELSHFRQPEEYTTENITRIFEHNPPDSYDLVNSIKASWSTISKVGTHETPAPLTIDAGDAYIPTDWILVAHEAILGALAHCNTCSCTESHGSLIVRIPLQSHRKETLECRCSVTFFINLANSWEEVHVSARKNAGAYPRLTVGDSDLDSSWPEEGLEDIVESLCAEFAFTRGRRLEYALECDGTNRLIRLTPTRPEWKWTNAISLEELLRRHDLRISPEDKRLLAIRLSYAIMHFFNSEWLQESWSSANIKFPIKPAGLCLAPHMEAQLEQSGSHAGGGSGGYGHPIPYLVTLAIQLMEVHEKMSFVDLAQQCGVTIEAQDDISKFLDACDVFGYLDTNGGLSQSDELFFKAIEHCLNKKLWVKISGDDLRMKIYQHVVRPLETHLIENHAKISLSELDQIQAILPMIQQHRKVQDFGMRSFRSATGSSNLQVQEVMVCATSSEQPRKERQVAVQAKNLLQLFDDETLDNLGSKTVSFQEWETEFDKVYNEFMRTSSDGPICSARVKMVPIKIAVIDTGYDAGHWAFKAIQGRIVKKCCSQCLEHPTSCTAQHMADEHGHGTHVAGLLSKFGKGAQLFIIKLDNVSASGFNSAKVHEISQHKVATALRLAVDQWNVDIISLSFGYASNEASAYKDIEDAISHATKRALIFAAARNSGPKKARAWPACEPGVFCVHSTTGDGNWSDFNPLKMHAELSLNLATVGEAVNSYWPICDPDDDKETGMIIKSGTSFATPIAAGTAAFLLSFAQKYLPDIAEQFKEFRNMRALIQAICRASVPPRHVAPAFSNLCFSTDQYNLFGKGLGEIKKVFTNSLIPAHG